MKERAANNEIGDTVIATRNHRGSSAEVCRQNGWGPGTRLVGDEGYGPTVIEITAVGEHDILAKCIAHAEGAVEPHEGPWALWCRDWREATTDEVPQPLEVGLLVEGRDRPDLRGTVVSGPDKHGTYIVAIDDKEWLLRHPRPVGQ